MFTGVSLRKTFSLVMAAVLIGLFVQTSEAMVNGTDISKEPLGTATGFLAVVEARRQAGSDRFKKCLGAAVTPDVIITAGHCLTDMSHVTVEFIKKVSPLKFETIQAKAWSIHPMYNAGKSGPMYENFDITESSKYHDLAVIILKSRSKIAVPISIVPRDFEPLTVRGNYYSFGHRRSADLYEYIGKIDFFKFHYVQNLDFAKHWYKAQMLGDVLSCEWDSGSPVTISAEDESIPGRDIHYLVGVQVTVAGNSVPPLDVAKSLLRWGDASAFPYCTRTLTFIDIKHHADWIEEVLREMDPANPRKIHYYGES